jgi:hypothetical protein
MKRFICLSLIFYLFFTSFCYGEDIKERRFGIGYLLSPAGFDGISIRHWITNRSGYQILLGGYREDKDYEKNYFFILGCGYIYKLSKKKNNNYPYIGLGIGGFKQVERQYIKKKIEEAYGGEFVFGIEHFSKSWKNFAAILEIGITYGKNREIYLPGKKEKNNTLIYFGIGLGGFYYF